MFLISKMIQSSKQTDLTLFFSMHFHQNLIQANKQIPLFFLVCISTKTLFEQTNRSLFFNMHKNIIYANEQMSPKQIYLILKQTYFISKIIQSNKQGDLLLSVSMHFHQNIIQANKQMYVILSTGLHLI